MIDFTRERPTDLKRVADHFGFALSTVRKWVNRGEGGVRLESVKIGREYRTSMEAAQRFLARINGQQPPAVHPGVSAHDPHGDLQRTQEAFLEAYG